MSTWRAARSRNSEVSRAGRAIDNAQKGAERAATLTQRLLAFSRRQPLAPKPIDVDRLVAGMSDLLHRALGEIVELETVSTAGLWRVEADPNQLEATILNLAVNARDAMPEGGKLTIETANVRLDEQYAAAHAEVAPGSYVLLAVTDTGHGMSREVLSKALDPFFTTKEDRQRDGPRPLNGLWFRQAVGRPSENLFGGRSGHDRENLSAAPAPRR